MPRSVGRAQARLLRRTNGGRETALREPAGSRDDVLFARNHQEGRIRQWRVRIDANNPLEWTRTKAAFGDCRDDALAHAGTVATFVDDDDALRCLRLFDD